MTSDFRSVHRLGQDWEANLRSGTLVTDEISEASIRYEFIDNSDYVAMAENRPGEANCVYVSELLYRTHFAAAATVVRSVRWAQGVEAAVAAGLLLPMCANLRGLLEAAADSHHSLKGVYTTLAEARTLFNRALGHTLHDRLVTAAELESVLIHFSHARRLTKKEKDGFSPEHQAKEAKTYLAELDSYAPGGWYVWYQELCEYAHPAASSTAYMILPEANESFVFSPKLEAAAIERLLRDWRSRIPEVLRVSLLPALLVLKVLTFFRLSPVHTRAIRKFDFSDVPAWQKCARIMKVPIS
jgi:hypothetical protein